jgi:hypothetical protein
MTSSCCARSGGIRQGGEQLQPSREVRHRFQISRALEGPLAGLLPIGNGLRHQTSFDIVMRQQLGLSLTDLGEACLHHLGNVLMVPLAGALEQRLIGRVLDQGMLEAVRRLWRQTLLIEELCLHQLLQPPLQGALVPRRNGLQQGIGKLAPERRPELCEALHRRQAVQPRHQRVVQCGGNRQRRQGPGQLIALCPLLEQPRLQHHLGQFLHEQRHPIGLGHHLLHDLGW